MLSQFLQTSRLVSQCFPGPVSTYLERAAADVVAFGAYLERAAEIVAFGAYLERAAEIVAFGADDKLLSDVLAGLLLGQLLMLMVQLTNPVPQLRQLTAEVTRSGGVTGRVRLRQ